MKKYISIFLFFFSFSIALSGQGWVEILNTPGLQTTNTIGLSDGNFATVLRAPNGIANSDAGNYLIKYDLNGQIILLEKINDAPNNFSVLVIESPDGGYFIWTNDGLLVKLDANFQEEWSNLIIFDSQTSGTSRMADPFITADGHLIIAGSAGVNGVGEGYFRKYDLDFNLIWETAGHPSLITDIIENSSGELTFFYGGTSSAAGMGVGKVSGAGIPIWVTDLTSTLTFGTNYEIVGMDDGNFMLFQAYNPAFTATQSKFNGDGELEWTKELIDPTVFSVLSKQVKVSDGFVTTGTIGGAFPGEGFANLMLLKTDFDGNVVWLKNHHVEGTNSEYCRSIVATPDGGFIGATEFGDGTNEGRGVYLFRANAEGNIYEQQLTGIIARDSIGNCDINDAAALEGWTISASNADHTIHASSDETGLYTLNVPTGIYTITVHPPNDLWEVCDNNETLGFVENSQLNKSYVVQAVAECSAMAIQTTFPIARPCFDNNAYNISYCNQGTIMAEDAFVEISIDSDLTYVSSSIPLSSQSDNVLTFDIGDIPSGDCGDFNVIFMIDCETELDETICLYSSIFPDDDCGAITNPWEGAFVEALVGCETDSIDFSLLNSGLDDMNDTRQFIIIEDAIVLFQSDYQLEEASSLNIKVPANGSTYIMEAMQEVGAPGVELLKVWVEGCGANQNGEFSTGFVNQYSLGDNNPQTDTECREASAAYDPNDKEGLPRGYGTEHFLAKNTDIEYLIRFQNTGNDTAFTVVLLDTIAPELNLSTLRIGPASHDFEWEIIDGNVLQYTFNSILLPDSTTNFVASNGFAKFTISQQPDLADGTVIKNDVGIYFDFNEVVMTNETYHTIGEDFIEVSTQNPVIQSARIEVYPNPFNNFTQIKMGDLHLENGNFELYDLSGRLVFQQQFSGNQFTFHRNENILSGNYFYKVMDDQKGMINNGQLSIQ